MYLLLRWTGESNCSKAITQLPLYSTRRINLHSQNYWNSCLAEPNSSISSPKRLMLKLHQWLLQGIDRPHQINIYFYPPLEAEALSMALSQQLSHSLCTVIISWQRDAHYRSQCLHSPTGVRVTDTCSSFTLPSLWHILRLKAQGWNLVWV